MIQIIPEAPRKPSLGQRLSQGVGTGLQMGKQLMQQHQQQQAIKSYADELGIGDISRLPLELQKEIFSKELQGRNKAQELAGKSDLENTAYGHIKDAFGEKFANIWKASPTGARTELEKFAIDARNRGLDVEKILQNVPDAQPNISEELQENKPIPQMRDGKVPKDFQWPDYSKPQTGYTQKDWNEEKRTWRKENAPIFEANKTRLAANKKDELDIKRLSKISNNLPQGFERIIINPETGEPYGIAQLTGQVSPDVQEWIKITSRFGNRAKDAFGSRVTNFDLTQYMKQFPGLLNTTEGRQRILKMMQINNKLDLLYDKALNQVYKKYGLNGIPQEEADKLAQSFIQEEVDNLHNQYLSVDAENEQWQQSQPLSNELIDFYLDQSGGDPEKAAEMAQRNGITW